MKLILPASFTIALFALAAVASQAPPEVGPCSHSEQGIVLTNEAVAFAAPWGAEVYFIDDATWVKFVGGGPAKAAASTPAQQCAQLAHWSCTELEHSHVCSTTFVDSVPPVCSWQCQDAHGDCPPLTIAPQPPPPPQQTPTQQ